MSCLGAVYGFLHHCGHLGIHCGLASAEWRCQEGNALAVFQEYVIVCYRVIVVGSCRPKPLEDRRKQVQWVLAYVFCDHVSGRKHQCLLVCLQLIFHEAWSADQRIYASVIVLCQEQRVAPYDCFQHSCRLVAIYSYLPPSNHIRRIDSCENLPERIHRILDGIFIILVTIAVHVGSLGSLIIICGMREDKHYVVLLAKVLVRLRIFLALLLSRQKFGNVLLIVQPCGKQTTSGCDDDRDNRCQPPSPGQEIENFQEELCHSLAS